VFCRSNPASFIKCQLPLLPTTCYAHPAFGLVPPSCYSAFATQCYLLFVVNTISHLLPAVHCMRSTIGFLLPPSSCYSFFTAGNSPTHPPVGLWPFFCLVVSRYRTRNAIDYAAVVTAVLSTLAKLRMTHVYACASEGIAQAALRRRAYGDFREVSHLNTRQFPQWPNSTQ
jgi:hypothetical protein